jgi:hypothetical protein
MMAPEPFPTIWARIDAVIALADHGVLGDVDPRAGFLAIATVAGAVRRDLDQLVAVMS